MIEYTKYKKGAIHWNWYADENHNYHKLVNDSLMPFENVPKGLIVDVGFGDGLPANLLLNKQFDIYGIEPSADAIDIATERLEDIKDHWSIYQGTIEEFVQDDIEEVEFDYLYSLNTIEHTDRPELYKDIMRKVKNFGIIVTDKADNSGKGHSSFHTREFTQGQLINMFKDEFNVEPLNINHPCFIGIKVSRK